MSLKQFAAAALLTGALTGCADPSVWSAVAPGYEGGVRASRVLINVQSMPEPQRQWSEQALVEEMAKLGVTPVRTRTTRQDILWDDGTVPPAAASPRGDTVLTMKLMSERVVTVDVPITYHPGETRVTTYEHKGKTVTEIRERPGYTTGGYSYDVPVAQANFAITKRLPGPDGIAQTQTIWTARAEVEGRQRTGWAALSADMARRAVKRLGEDKVLIVPPPLAFQAARR